MFHFLVFILLNQKRRFKVKVSFDNFPEENSVLKDHSLMIFKLLKSRWILDDTLFMWVSAYVLNGTKYETYQD